MGIGLRLLVDANAAGANDRREWKRWAIPIRALGWLFIRNLISRLSQPITL